MNIVFKELTKKFTQEKYPMSSGSDEWQDIKGDFEIEDDALGGAMSYEYNKKSLGQQKLQEFKSELEKFKIRVDNYSSKDDLETKEKEILLGKLKVSGTFSISIKKGKPHNVYFHKTFGFPIASS